MEHLFPLLVAAFLVGLSKGGLASAGTLAVPGLAIIMNPVQAAAILLPIYILTDVVGVWLYRHDYSRRNLKILIPSMLLGTLVATLAVAFTPEALLLVVTGLIGLWFVLRLWLGRKDNPAKEARLGAGVFWGTVAGVTSFITHTGGPPVQAYLLPQRLPKLAFAGTITIAFAIVNLSKIPGYWAIGTLDAIEWRTTFILAVSGVIGTVAGRWLTQILSEAMYRRVIEALLFVLSVVLIGKGFSELL